MRVTVATDGSALNNPKGPGGWAWVVDNNSWNGGSVDKASNQMMELYAIIRALEEIPMGYDILLLTDSKFAVDTLGKDGRSGWMRTWKARGWKKADGSQPKNLKLLEKLDQVLSRRKGTVEFQWVKGHSTNKLNTIADRICTSASKAKLINKQFNGGPGWTGALPPEKPVTSGLVAPRLKSVASLTPQSATIAPPTTPLAARRATRKATPVKRRRKSPEYAITSFDDGLDMPESKEKKQETVLCDSCGAPINALTKACRCFTS